MFSVVIPLYNKEQAIERAIRSVLNQTVQDFEVIVVDDGSTDGGAQIVECIEDARIHLVRQENQGVSVARNRGMSEASWDLVAFLDADDEWLPTFLGTVARMIAEFPHCCAYATRYLVKQGEMLRPAIVRGLPDRFEGLFSDYFAIAAQSAPPIHSSAICVRKTVFEQLGGFPPGVTAGEDLIAWARLASVGDVSYTMSCQSVFHVSTAKFAPGRMVDRRDLVGDELLKILSASPHIPSLRKYLALWHRMRASTFFRHGLQARALLESGKSLYYHPFEKRTYLLLSASLVPCSSRLLSALSREGKAANA